MALIAAQNQHMLMQRNKGKVSVRSVRHMTQGSVVQAAAAHLYQQVLQNSMQVLQGTTMQQPLQEPQQKQELLLLPLQLRQGELAVSTFAGTCQCSGMAQHLLHVLPGTCCLSRQQRMHGWTTLAPSTTPSLLSALAASCPLMRRCGAPSGHL